MKKIRVDKPFGVIVHIYMEISQGNSLCSYLYPNKQKCHFFIYKIREQEGRTGPAQEMRAGTSRRGEVVGKGGWMVNTVQKCVHMYVNAKLIPVETIPGIGAEGIKSNRRFEFKYDIFDTL
jgi:hypothetical protein